MREPSVSRREFLRDSALAAAACTAGILPAGAAVKDKSKILNYNENMEYRRLGKTNLMISAVCLGGHWKLVNRIIGAKVGDGWQGVAIDQPEFIKNRDEVVSRCIELGINYVDACSGTEIMAYSRALRGRRDKMYLGFSWYEYEMRFHPWRDSYEKMMEGFEKGMKQAQLDYVDLWRISMEVDTGKNQTEKEVEIAIKCLEAAKKSGKARFVGLSSHDRVWLKKAIETYPQIEVILTPYTAASKEMPKDSLFDAVRKCDVGVLGIKPFASNSLFKNPGVYDGPDAAENDKRARMAIRNILANPAITAPMPGLISVHQVDNVAQAVKERRQLDLAEWNEFQKVAGEMWASLPPDYQWLRNWEFV